MKIGVTVGLGGASEATPQGLAARVAKLEEQGFATAWMANASAMDAITALVVAGQVTSAIELGTAVVPTFPRHPVALAQQALTAQAALDGRFTLGIGPSHEVVITAGLGIPFDRPAAHTREYLAVLGPLLVGEPVSHRGEIFRVETALTVPAAPVPVLVAALGPVMLKLAGAHAAGTITSWVGPRTLADHIVPTMAGAASDAGRTEPRVVVGLPIAITDDPDSARERLAPQLAFYDTLPSYKAMFDREGVRGPAELMVLGDEKSVDAELDRLADAGATDFAAQVISVGPGSVVRTIEHLRSRL